MDKFSIEGPSRIRGEVKISGSKNSSLPILASTLLFNQPVVIKNLPKVKDINTMINLLRSLGSKIILSKDKRVARIHNKKNLKTFFVQIYNNLGYKLQIPSPSHKTNPFV